MNNPLAHELTTGPEIIAAIEATPSTSEKPSSGKVDVFVAGAGTGGTVTGVSRAVKKHNKDTIVVATDPVSLDISLGKILTSLKKGSILAYPDTLNVNGTGAQYVVEGIGYDFIPDVLSRDVKDIDTWIKTSDQESFDAVQALMRSEGLLVGGSCGSALSGALIWLKTSEVGKKVAQTPGKNVVIMLPDGYVLFIFYEQSTKTEPSRRIRNYMSKEWFIKLAMEREPSPLANEIARLLKK